MTSVGVLPGLEPETVEEAVGALPSRMLAATLGDPVPDLASGSPVASLAHWLHCLPIVTHGELDDNGHPRRGRNLPALEFEKRMFAGSDINFLQPIRVGNDVRRTAATTDVALKNGRSGDFYLVNLRQEYTCAGDLLLVEDQKIVYRAAVNGGAGEPVAAPALQPEWTRTYLPDERMLFRYSALLFSAHRIHFDRAFALREGYPALVVHGQLAATCLLDLAEANMVGRLEHFSYRSTAPLFESRTMTACGAREGNEALLWMLDDSGSVSIRARARFAI